MPLLRSDVTACSQASAISGSTAGNGSGTPMVKSSSWLGDLPRARHSASMSSALCVKNPTVSKEGAYGRIPSVGNKPNVGLNPVTPQYDAGRTVEPVVWVPMASGTIPAAIAAAEPLELPPGV